ncbi:hypothetical protein [Sedimenticola thiotaurini]|uniref:hypothetical protein n=1 Tax=Sedimenticola thiotaurini TaxID=1543721 RepID=UPI000699514D|nr:hypothetical protein [Sedimenticola thiotaurini]
MDRTLSPNLKPAIDQLRHAGLNLVAILDMECLPNAMADNLAASYKAESRPKRVILIGNGGRALWESIPDSRWQQTDPIDQYSYDAAEQFARRVAAGYSYQIIYPGDSPVPLQQLGSITGWHTPSPLGIGINPQWGLWFAYRAALLTDAPLPEIVQPAPASPCSSCREKPCISLCPAGALAADSVIDMNRCARHRLTPRSNCANRCLARLGCPVAAEQRYTLEQIEYHYRLSLETLRHYF